MATSIILIFILLLIDNVITINDWAIKDATSVVCVPNNLKLDFFVLSANKNTLNIRKEDINYAVIDGGSHQLRYFGQMQGMQIPFIDLININTK